MIGASVPESAAVVAWSLPVWIPCLRQNAKSLEYLERLGLMFGVRLVKTVYELLFLRYCELKVFES